MPLRARLNATIDHAPTGAQCLTIHNVGEGEARVIILSASDPATGKDWSWMIEKPSVRRLSAGQSMGLEVGDGSGPVSLVVTVSWVDNAGVPGTWSGPLQRGRSVPLD